MGKLIYELYLFKKEKYVLSFSQQTVVSDILKPRNTKQQLLVIYIEALEKKKRGGEV